MGDMVPTPGCPHSRLSPCALAGTSDTAGSLLEAVTVLGLGWAGSEKSKPGSGTALDWPSATVAQHGCSCRALVSQLCRGSDSIHLEAGWEEGGSLGKCLGGHEEV